MTGSFVVLASFISVDVLLPDGDEGFMVYLFNCGYQDLLIFLASYFLF
jgi:hypothetical protein